MKTRKERGFTHVHRGGPNMASMAAAAVGDIPNSIRAATPGGIEAQEREGQQAQAKLETLPIDMQGCTVKDFEKLGFTFGEKTDRIFWKCSFPKGWTKRPSGHSMWSDLLDDKGRKRGSIFFKAAFYDYNAHIGLNPRYTFRSTYLDEKKEEIYDRATGEHKADKMGVSSKFVRVDVIDTATKEVLHSSDPLPEANWDKREEAMARSKAIDEAKEAANVWLTQKFPSWRDPLVYWG